MTDPLTIIVRAACGGNDCRFPTCLGYMTRSRECRDACNAGHNVLAALEAAGLRIVSDEYVAKLEHECGVRQPTNEALTKLAGDPVDLLKAAIGGTDAKP